MTISKIFAMPHIITDYDDTMLVPLARNFSETEGAIARTQLHVNQLYETITTLTEALEALTLAHNNLVEAVEGYHP